MTTLIITKIDAACRQLDSAITLYFQDGDPVAVHTLACAAHQVIHDINRNTNGKYAPEMLFNNLNFKEEFRASVIKCFHRNYNFFKHANNDPDPNGETEFNTKTTEMFMLFAMKGLSYLGVQYSNKMIAFSIYMQIHNPALLKNKDIFSDTPIDIIDNIRGLDRSEFFHEFLRSRREA